MFSFILFIFVIIVNELFYFLIIRYDTRKVNKEVMMEYFSQITLITQIKKQNSAVFCDICETKYLLVWL